MIFPSTEWEQDQPAIKASAEMQPVSSDGSEAECEIKGSDEEGVQNKGAQKKMRRKPDRKSSARGQTDFCVCPTCGQGFLSIAPFEKHMKIHKQEPDSQRPIPTCVLQISSSEPPLTTSALNREEELQGTSSQPSTQEESNFSQAEVQTDLCIKDEQEEHEHDRQTQEVIYPSTETEQDQPVNEASAEMQPVSSDGSEAESEIKGGGEEVVQNEGAQRKMRRKTDRTFSVSGQTDLHVCPMCGKGFWFISPLVKHMKKHKKINGPTKKLLKDMQRFLRRKDCNVCGKKFTTTHCLRLHSKIHAAIRDFKCQVCGITFCKRRNLISHLRTKRHKRRHEEDILNRFGTGQKRLWKCSCARY
nr:zinc finger protein 436-like [Labrus bergylta]